MKVELTMKEIYATIAALDHTKYLFRDKRRELANVNPPDKETWDAVYKFEIELAGSIQQKLLKISDEQRTEEQVTRAKSEEQ